MKFVVAFFILFLCFFISCSGISPQQQAGIDKMSKGNYADAVVDLESAQKDDPKDEVLALQLSDAKYKFAQDDLQKITILNPNDYPTQLFHLKRAKEQMEAAIKLLEIKMEEENEPKKNLKEKNEFFEKINAELAKRDAEYQKVLVKTQSLSASAQSKIENSFLDCQNLSPFKDFIPEVKETMDSLGKKLVSELEKKGWDAFKIQKIAEAQKQFEKILKYFPDHKAGIEGQLCVKIYEGNKKQDYRKAYASLEEMKTRNAESTCVSQYEKSVLEKLIKNEYAQAQKFEKEKKISSLLKALDHYQFLLGLASVSVEQKKSFQESMTKGRLNVASLLVSKSKILRSGGRENLPLVATYLKWAYRFNPDEAKKQVALMEEADKYIKEKNEFRITLFTKKNENPLLGELEAAIKQKLVVTASGTLVVEAAPENSPVKQYKDLMKYSLKGQDFFLWVQLFDYQAEEYGANQPYYKTSRYVSGTRQLDNPDWFAAQQEFNNAQAAYNQSYQYNQQMKSNCNNMNNPFAAGICSGMVEGLSTGRLDNARAVLNQTPRFIQENIISDYTYRQYKVGVNLYMRLEMKFYDAAHKASGTGKMMEYKVSRKEGEVLEGVQPSDVNGVKEGRYNVPVLSEEKMAGHRKLASDIEEEMKALVLKERGFRYCRSSEKKAESLLSCYQLCLIYGPKEEELKDKTEQQKIQLAKKKLSEFYGLTQEDVSKYALPDGELPKGEESSFQIFR